MDIFMYFKDMVLAPVDMLFDRDGQTYWITYIGTAVFSAVVYALNRRGKSLRLRAMLKYVFPKKIFFHPSTVLDLKLSVLGAFYIFLQAGILVSISTILNSYVTDVLSAFSGTSDPVFFLVPVWVKLLLPLVIFVVFELGYWACHYLMHRSAFLWEFHKVHHSAEVMSPLTELRQHPLELFLFPFIISLTMCFLYGVLFWLYGNDLSVYKYWNMGVFVVVFFSTFGHLRHSHVNIGTSGIWSYIFQSPLHHQIHHSTDPKHFDTNLGFCLSVWDWAFGTLYLPEKGQKIEFGVNDELRTNYSLKTHLFEPFRQAWLVLTGRKRPYAKTVTRSTINS